MDDSGIGQGRAPSLHRWLWAFAAWALGIVMSIATNLISGNPVAAQKVMWMGFAVVGAVFGTCLIWKVDRSSTFRNNVWPVTLFLAVPLISVSVLGVWGYAMLIVAVIVGIGASSEPRLPSRQGVQIALVKLGGIFSIATGPSAIKFGLHGFEDLGFPMRGYVVLGGILLIVMGAVLLFISPENLPARFARVDQYSANRLVLIGGIGLGYSIFYGPGLFAEFPPPIAAAIFVPAVGLWVATLGCGVVRLLTSERIGRVKAGWDDVSRQRERDDPAPSFGQLMQRLARWLGERSGMGPPPWSRPQRGDPDGDS